MHITATMINLFHICKRQMWLHANGIRMEHTSQVVAEGKLIGENSYGDRAAKYTELEIDGVKIDYYDAKNRVIHEVKKSDKAEFAHIAQVKYYLYILKKNGIEDAQAILEYPRLRQREPVFWEEGDKYKIEEWLDEVRQLLNQDRCPPLLNKPICTRCSYYEFCYAGEEVQAIDDK